MRATWRRSIPWLLGWAALALAGALVIVRVDIAQRRDAFETSARIAHRLLSQRAVQHDAILATLELLSPAMARADRPELRLPAVHPQVLAVLRRDGDAPWPDNPLRVAEARSRETQRAALGPIDAAAGQYTLVRAGVPSSFALRIDLQRMVPWDEWPLEPSGPVSASLQHAGQTLLLHPGDAAGAGPAGLTAGFVYAKALAAPSQPFVLRLQRATGPAEWPWALLFVWVTLAALGLAALGAWQRVQRGRRRAEELLRVGQVARLNALGELAGGIAHELNQPLTAVLANAQAARRLLDDDPPALATARDAMAQAAAQARRASEVLARLRHLVERPDTERQRQPVRLEAALRNVLDLLEPEARQRGIRTRVEGQSPAVLADPVALEQIVHNLIGNAMQALDEVPADERRLALQIGTEHGQGVLTVRDSGPGFAPEALPRLFEPFYSTRKGGLGLGLSLCESLAHAMQGSLRAASAAPRGAEFRLALPLAGRSV
ncbi:MAG: ATP-binding protein [Rhizobacter sp.]|nr:ATP-binding protein [Rhizobacter sp.]